MYVKNFRFKPAELGVFLDASKVASELSPGCRIMGLTNGEFSLIDLVFHILSRIGKSNVAIATWSAGIKDANQVRWLLDSDLIGGLKILTDHSYATRQKRYAVEMEELFGKENIRTSEMHAKFVLIWNGAWRITIRTSMNLNANKTCETFEIDDNPEIFDFYMGYVEHTFGTMPDGVEGSSWKARMSLDRFFQISGEKEKKATTQIVRKF